MITWNKVTVYFSIPSFPTTSANAAYKFLMKVGGNSSVHPSIAWPTIASNLPTYPSGSLLNCDYDVNSTTQIACTNVGGALSSGTYWLALSLSFATA